MRREPVGLALEYAFQVHPFQLRHLGTQSGEKRLEGSLVQMDTAGGGRERFRQATATETQARQGRGVHNQEIPKVLFLAGDALECQVGQLGIPEAVQHFSEGENEFGIPAVVWVESEFEMLQVLGQLQQISQTVYGFYSRGRTLQTGRVYGQIKAG